MTPEQLARLQAEARRLDRPPGYIVRRLLDTLPQPEEKEPDAE